MRRRRLVVGGGVIVLVAVIVAAIVSLSGGKGKSAATLPAPKPSLCPLTHLPAPGGHVPNRPALAVKIGNEPNGARPQSGLNEADIVYDTPAEGFIMRYVAVYQCHGAAAIGPTRSVRWVDWHILAAFGHPILAFAGGINPDVNTVESLGWLKPADLLTSASGAAYRTTNRVPPDNLYTSTAKLWALFPHDTTPPPPVFQFGGALPAAAQATSTAQINFSPGTDVKWEWQAAAGDWLHTYAGSPDIDTLTNKPVTTDNIIIQIVHYHFGPYQESPGSTGDVESQLVGSGKGWVLRDGKRIAVTWHRPSPSSPTTFTDAAGKKVTLTPGRSWVEIVPSSVAANPANITFTP